jgi:hypothetical protein
MKTVLISTDFAPHQIPVDILWWAHVDSVSECNANIELHLIQFFVGLSL